MKKILLFVLINLFACHQVLASTSERLKATGENIKGNTQETIGKITNDEEMQAQGKANKTKSKLRDTKENIKDIITD